MGGSSIYLAKTLGCDVTGVTLSSVQRGWAALAARMNGVSRKTRFLATDAETVQFEPESFDVVWSVECTEHLFDKPAFFRRVAGWLRPGGRVAICAWQAGDGRLSADAERQVYDVCEGFFCPSLGSSEDYRGWFTDAGLHVDRYLDWTSRVAQTWEICAPARSVHSRSLAGSVDRQGPIDVSRPISDNPSRLPERRDDLRLLGGGETWPTGHRFRPAREYRHDLSVIAYLWSEFATASSESSTLQRSATRKKAQGCDDCWGLVSAC